MSASKTKNGRNERPPAYQWYPGDAAADARYRAMSYEQRGIYRELLDLQWMNGPLSGDTKRLAKVLGVTHARFRKAWDGGVSDCFLEQKDGTFVNERLAREFERLQNQKAKAAANGRRGAISRWGGQSPPTDSPMAKDGTSAPALASTSALENTPPTPPCRGGWSAGAEPGRSRA